MHASLFFFAFLVSLSSAATYTVGQGDFVSRLEGVLLPGDEVIFPGLAAAPVEYTVNEFFSVSWMGTEGNPIVIRAAEVGGAIIRQMATQNILNVVRGQYFELKGLTFTGGSLGIRLGTGMLPTDTVTNALFEDLTITGTQGALITANSPANPAALKIVSDLIFRRLHLHRPMNPTGTNECMYLGANLAGQVEQVRFQNSIIEYCYMHDTLPADNGYGAALQLKPGARGNIVRYNVFHDVLIGVFAYDNLIAGTANQNQIYNNVIWSATDNCIQITAGNQVHDNIVFDCASNGIQVAQNGLLDGTFPRNNDILYNTVVRSPNGIRATVTGTNGLTVANNLILTPGGMALNTRMDIVTNSMFGTNAVLGTAAGFIPDVVTLTGTISTILEQTGNANDVSSAWPRDGVTAAATAAQFQPPVDMDFNCNPRPTPANVGAYQRGAFTDNPGWAIRANIRPTCAASPGQTTVATTPTSTVATTPTTVATTPTTVATTPTTVATTPTTTTNGGTSSTTPSTSSTSSGATTSSTTMPVTTSTTSSTSMPATTSTTVGGGPTTSTTTTIVTTTPLSGPQPVVPCSFTTFADPDIPFQLTIQMEYTDFNCNSFTSDMSVATQGSAINVHRTASGSVIVDGSVRSQTAMDGIFACVESSSCGMPISSVSSNGRSAVPGGSGLPLWVIVLVAIVGVALIIGLIIIIIWCCKRRSGGSYKYDVVSSGASSSRSDAPMQTYNVSSTPTPLYSGPTTVVPSATITLELQFDVIDEGEGVLKAKKNDIVFCESEDWAKTDAWLYVKHGKQQGYVPRQYCKRK